MGRFVIGDTMITWYCPDYSMHIGRHASLFLYDGPWDGPSIDLYGQVAPVSRFTSHRLVRKEYLYDQYCVDGERMYLYHWGIVYNAYVIFPDRVAAGRKDGIFLDPELIRHPPLDMDWFLGVSGLNKALLYRGKPVLHAACVAYRKKAIAFTAPSETGKSTQADLWEKHLGARILNGDRVLLGQRGDVWYAHGYPACGSSNICLNESAPLAAVVCLAQSPENRVEPLTASAAQRALVTGMALYRDDSREMDAAFRAAEGIYASVPVIRLFCRPDGQAVSVLETYLKEVGAL